MLNTQRHQSKIRQKMVSLNSALCGFFTILAFVGVFGGCGGSSSSDPSSDPLNTSPVAIDDVGVTFVGTPLTLNVLVNDSDTQNDTLAITTFTQPQNGSVTNNGDGSFTYTPNAGFTGTDTFTYTLSDGRGGSATGIVTITVNVASAGNNPPVVSDDTVTTVVGTPIIISVLANDTDVDTDPLTITRFSLPTVGLLADNPDGTFTYTPPATIAFNGNIRFTYVVSDGRGGIDTGTVSVAILQAISRVSNIDAAPGIGGNGNSGGTSSSADGRFVAFESLATNLTAVADANVFQDIYLHDRLTGTTTRVSMGLLSAEPDGLSSLPKISADGGFVVFESQATNLVTADTNGLQDIFLWSRITGSITRVSVDSLGAQAIGGDSSSPSITADGSIIAFDSDATNLIAVDVNAATDIFIRIPLTASTSRVSVDSNGAPGNDDSTAPALSADGNFVVFDSNATNLVALDTNLNRDIFFHNRLTGTTERISVASNATQGNGDSQDARVSDDGRIVAFESLATNLVAADTNALSDIFVHDRQNGTTTRISVASDGSQGVGGVSLQNSMSADGRYVAFESDATNLVPADTNAATDVFVHDRATATTRRLSVAADGTDGTGISDSAAITPNGHYVTFESNATNLVPADVNGNTDAFAAPNP